VCVCVCVCVFRVHSRLCQVPGVSQRRTFEHCWCETVYRADVPLIQQTVSNHSKM